MASLLHTKRVRLIQNEKASRRLAKHVLLFTLVALLASPICQSIIKQEKQEQNLDPDLTTVRVRDKGDCNAIGQRLPKWYNRNYMLKSIPEFRRLYKNRPFKENVGGMRFDHSIALWFILKNLRPTPKFVVESGAHKGHSTWLIRNSLPSATIISLSPGKPMIRFPNVLYFNGMNFTDFGSVDFRAIGVNPKQSVVFLDDHQSAFKRIFEEGAAAGFRRFIQEDNFGYQRGDNLNMKWLCEVDRKEEWRGIVFDNFGKIRTNQTWDEHLAQVNILDSNIKEYAEFPPTVSASIAKPRIYDPNEATKPLIEDMEEFKQLCGTENILEVVDYHYICYVELK